MSRETKSDKLRVRLEAAEGDFRELLISSLQKCKDGSLGVFLTDAKASRLGDVYPRLVWPEARRLERLGDEIRSLRAELGEALEGGLCTRYSEYCAMDVPNEVGSKKLATEFLAEIEDRYKREGS